MKKPSLLASITLVLLVLCAAAAVAASAPSTSAPASVAAIGGSAAADVAAPSPTASGAQACHGPLLPATLSGDGTRADATRGVSLDTGVTCGPRRYSCELCQPGEDGLELCYTQTCGTFVIVHCDSCAPECVLPPG